MEALRDVSENVRGDGGKGGKVFGGNLAVACATLERHGCQHVLGKAQLTNGVTMKPGLQS